MKNKSVVGWVFRYLTAFHYRKEQEIINTPSIWVTIIRDTRRLLVPRVPGMQCYHKPSRVTGLLHGFVGIQAHQQKATSGTETLRLHLHSADQETTRHLEVKLAPHKACCFHQQKG